jgi:hypothetical protein
MANTFYIEIKYAKLLSSRLPNFKQSRSDLWSFSHHCEKKRDNKKLKSRGFIYTREGKLFVKCHNCGYSHTFATFIKETDPILADEYRMEMYKARVESGEIVNRISNIQQKPQQDFFKLESKLSINYHRDSILDGLQPVCDLSECHPAKLYVKNRCIPETLYDRIFFSRRFIEFASKISDRFNPETMKEYPRLILPYFDANDRVYAITARSFGDEQPKYIFLRVSENSSNIYGLWRINPSEKIIAVEGQIDSLCLDNCIAVGGADYSNPLLKQLQSNLIIVPDNDFVRNPDVANQVEKAIKHGYTISLFPDGFKHKDINDAIKAGIKSDTLRNMILDNAKTGLSAKLELTFRRKR